MIESIQNITHNNNHKNKSYEKADKEIIQLFSNFQSEDSLFSFINALNMNRAFEKILPSEYKIDDKILFLGSAYNMGQTAKNLILANNLNLTCAPKLEGNSINKNGKYQIILCKLPDKILPYNSGIEKVTMNNKASFFSDARKLSNKLNKYNPHMVNPDNWYFNQGKIYIPDWSILKTFNSEKEKQEFLKQLSKLLGFIYY